MPRHFRFLSLALLVLCAGVPPAQAALKVLATTPDWGSLVNELGGDKVNVYTATSPFQDVHRVDAKPSLVARARSADLVVATGADLEIGWMPVLLQDSGNSRIQPGAPGYFEAAPLVPLLEVPSAVDRSMGDIHPLGNPHVTLDAHNIAIIAKALSARLVLVDPANAAYYASRGEDFQKRWQQATLKWEAEAAPLRGVPVAVIHRDQAYLCHWLGIRAHASGLGAGGWITQVAAAAAALVGALLLTWTERKRPEAQEALIGVLFVLASTAQILLLANDPHGGEDLKDLLAGQILWVTPRQLVHAAIVTGIFLLAWFRYRERLGRVGFYVLFAFVVTISVQLVGVYLVFTSLIVPAVATYRYPPRRQLLLGYMLALASYLVGLALSAVVDLPSIAVIVWAMALIAVLVHLGGREEPGNARH